MVLKYASRIVGLGLTCWVVVSAVAQESLHAPPDNDRRLYERPTGLPFPPESPYSSGAAELGRELFFDPILSRSRAMSCATCHQPSLAWGNGLPLAIGDNGGAMSRRSPTLLNLAWLPRLGWDGSFKDIEAVGFTAITGPKNMNLPEDEALQRLQADPAYQRAFAHAFGPGGITRTNVEAALATYERTLVSGEAPFDRWVSGDPHAISDAAQRGFALFNGRANCSGCHKGWTFTDGSFHDIGVEGDDVGRGRFFPTSGKLRHAFKTPTLRDVAQRAPYMHNGSVKTLADVIDLYDRGGIDRPSRAALIRPLGLSAQNKADLLAFLSTLTSDASAPPLAPVSQ